MFTSASRHIPATQTSPTHKRFIQKLIKVKTKFVNDIQEFVKNALYISNISFEFYHLEEAGVKGCYAKITKVTPSTPPPGCEVEVAVNDEN